MTIKRAITIREEPPHGTIINIVFYFDNMTIGKYINEIGIINFILFAYKMTIDILIA